MERFLKKYINDQPLRMITYKKYMELALYHPEYGYYNRPSEKIGTRGDFYTSSNVGDAFGRALGKWFIYLFRQFELPLHIVELGAGTGRLAHAILTYLKEEDQVLFSRLQYTLVESSPHHREKQQSTLSQFERVIYVESIDCLVGLEGIVFSNELFDALPVHVIEKRDSSLYESMIMFNEKLEEVLVKLENTELKKYIEDNKIKLVNKQKMEVPLAMISLYKDVIQKMKKGILLTVDYGYTEEEWQDPAHSNGSLRGYLRHQMIDNVLQMPGDIDLTTHIHWDILREIGELNQMQTISFLPQAEFLMACGILNQLQNTISADPFSLEHKRNRAIRSLIQDGQISAHFQVLVQSKNLENSKHAFY